MRGRVGLVIPVWFPEDVPDAVCERLLRTTLADWETCLRAEHVALVVDGVPRLRTIAERLADELTGGGPAAFRVLAPAVNVTRRPTRAAGLIPSARAVVSGTRTPSVPSPA